MFCGFTLGSGCGVLVAAELVPAYGWRSVLLLGGILPLVLMPVLIILMPESVRYLVANKTSRVRVAALLRRINPIELGPYTEFTLNEIKSSGSPVRQLFAKGFRNGTLLLWCVFFMSLLIVYLMTSWLPTLIHNARMTLTDASRVAALYQIGGTAGALTLGRLMDRFRPPVVLGISYAAAAPFIISLGQVHGLWLAVFVAGVGFFINGSQIGANAFSAQFYPTESRVTGISWALGVGRLGSIFGAVMGGVLLAANMPLSTLFVLFSIPAVLASLAAFGCGFGPGQPVAVPANP
jgi:AAHS family 4-hydroxybenzoate transporter-like MFS transporter